MLRFRDDDAAIHLHDAARLSQDQLDQARVFLPLAGPGLGQRRRLHPAQIDESAFGLGNNFLGYGQYNSLVDFGASVTDERCDIVARPHFGQRRQGSYFEAHAVRRKDETGQSGVRAKSSATSSGVSMSNISPGRRSTSAGRPFDSA